MFGQTSLGTIPIATKSATVENQSVFFLIQIALY